MDPGSISADLKKHESEGLERRSEEEYAMAKKIGTDTLKNPDRHPKKP